jgi:starvation-inducible outer membrane lipoprotein
MEGADVSMVNQYPAATNIGIDRAANVDLVNNRLTAVAAPPAGAGPNGRAFMVDGAADPTTCAATYVEAVGSVTGQVTIPATVTIVSSGC